MQRGSLQGPVVGETIKTSKASVLRKWMKIYDHCLQFNQTLSLVVEVLFLLVGSIYLLFIMIGYNIKIDYASLA